MGGHFSPRCSFIELKISFQSHSAVASSHLPHWAAYIAGRHPSIGTQCLDAWSQDQQAPWQWVLLLDSTWVMAPSSPSGWHTHTHTGLLPQCAETSAGTDTCGTGHHVSITTVNGDRHWCLTTTHLPSQRCLVCLPASWQWQFSLFNFHTVD